MTKKKDKQKYDRLQSQLPIFKLGDRYMTELGPGGKEVEVIELLCQRSWCKGITVVEVDKWWQRNLWEVKRRSGDYDHLPLPRFRTRACTYCGHWHRMPKRPKP